MRAPSNRRQARMGRLRLSKTGVYTIGLTLLVGLAAINTLNNMLFIAFGALLSVILTSGLVSEQTLFRLRVERRHPPQLYAEELAPFEIKVISRHRWIPAYALEVEEGSNTDDPGKRCFFLKVDPGQTQAATYRRAYAARGEVQLQGLWLRTAFPFGMFEKAQWIALPQTLVVFPAIHPASEDTQQAGHTPNLLTREGAGEDLLSARELRDGDDPRDILWARSAAALRPVVRVRQSEVPARIDVYLSLDLHPGRPFEDHVSHCASSLVHAQERGLHAVLHSGHHELHVASREQLHAALHYLALVAPEGKSSTAHGEDAAPNYTSWVEQ